MKKTVKLLSGLAIVLALSFVGFSSFATPEPVSENCCCPEGWQPSSTSHQNNIDKWDRNDDGVLCYKYLKSTGKEKGNGNGNNLGNYPGPINWKDNNNPCD